MEPTLADLTAREELNMKAERRSNSRSRSFCRATLTRCRSALRSAWGIGDASRSPIGDRRRPIAPLDTTGGLASSQPYRAALVELVDRVSAFGALKRAGAIQVPANVTGTLQAAGATASWTGGRRVEAGERAEFLCGGDARAQTHDDERV